MSVTARQHILPSSRFLGLKEALCELWCARKVWRGVYAAAISVEKGPDCIEMSKLKPSNSQLVSSYAATDPILRLRMLSSALLMCRCGIRNVSDKSKARLLQTFCTVT